MERKERRTFFCHIYIGAVGIISLQKLRGSLWGCEEAPGNFSSFYWLERIWVTHQRDWWGFWATRVTESVTQCVCVWKPKCAHKLRPLPVPADKHHQSGTGELRSLWRKSERSRVLKNICVFFSSAWFAHFMSWLTDLFVCPTAVRQRPSWAETRNQRSKTNKSVWLAQTKSLNSILFSNDPLTHLLH